MSRPLMNRLEAHLRDGGDAPSAIPLMKRMVLVFNVEMALRLLALVLMAVRF